jgi:hypothetical protein
MGKAQEPLKPTKRLDSRDAFQAIVERHRDERGIHDKEQPRHPRLTATRSCAPHARTSTTPANLVGSTRTLTVQPPALV